MGQWRDIELAGVLSFLRTERLEATPKCVLHLQYANTGPQVEGGALMSPVSGAAPPPAKGLGIVVAGASAVRLSAYSNTNLRSGAFTPMTLWTEANMLDLYNSTKALSSRRWL